MTKDQRSPLSQLLQHRVHSLSEIEEKNYGQRKAVLAYKCDRLRRSIFGNLKIRSFQTNHRQPRPLVLNRNIHQHKL